MFNTDLFEKELSTSWLGRELFFFDELGSTNTFAKNLIGDGSLHGALIITDHQTHGRGQYERSWETNSGENLTFSIVFEPGNGNRLTVLTLACALAVAEQLEDITKQQVELKWPNDVLVNENKIAGLLTEASFNGNKFKRVVIGIGLNVNQTEFSDELTDWATSIKNLTKDDSSREKLLARLLTRIEYYYRLWESVDIELIKKINKRLIGYGKWTSISVDSDLLDGEYKFLGINESGQMVVLNKELEVNTFSYEQVRVHFNSQPG